MCPTPLSSYPDCTLYIGPEALRRVEPETSAVVLRLLAKWSHVDVLWARLLATLLRGEFRVVARMLSAIRSAGARDEALKALLRDRLPKVDADLASSVLGQVRSARGVRNRFAHGLLGFAAQPDGVGDQQRIPRGAVVVVPPEVYAESEAIRRHDVESLRAAAEEVEAGGDDALAIELAMQLESVQTATGLADHARAEVWTRREVKGQCGVADVAAFEVRLLWDLADGGERTVRARRLLNARLLTAQVRHIAERDTTGSEPPILGLPPEDQPDLPADLF